MHSLSLAFAAAVIASSGPSVLAQEAPPQAAEKPWTFTFDVSGTGSFGKADNQSFRAALGGLREAGETRTALDAGYFFNASNGDRSESRFSTGILNDWLMPESPWFFFADGRYDYDEFKSWEHRVSSHGGAGYHLIARDDFSLDLRGGLGVVKEFASDNEDPRLEALAGFDAAWTISERQKLTFGSTIYPDLSDTGEFRLVSKADWSVLVDEKLNMSLSAGVLHEYETVVSPGIGHYDLKVYAGLRFTF